MSILKSFYAKKPKSTLKQDIVAAKNWIAIALKTSGYEADFSIGSLKEIDRFFDEQNTPDGLLSENRGIRLFAIGAYVGEVIIAEVGGEWITDDDDPQGEINVAVKLNNGAIIWPVQKVMKRYQNGREDSIYDYAYVMTM